jgi:hypothetical protein
MGQFRNKSVLKFDLLENCLLTENGLKMDVYKRQFFASRRGVSRFPPFAPGALACDVNLTIVFSSE